jgi:hypothetical protein
MRNCLLKGLNHTADLGSRLSASLLLKESNEGLESVGLLTGTGGGCRWGSWLGGLDGNGRYGGRLGLNWSSGGGFDSRGLGSHGGRLSSRRLRLSGRGLRSHSSGLSSRGFRGHSGRLGCRSRRHGALGRTGVVGLGLDALRVVWVPRLALKALSALAGTLEALTTALVVLLDGARGIGGLSGADGGEHGGRSNDNAGDGAREDSGGAVGDGEGSNNAWDRRSRGRGNLRLNRCGRRGGNGGRGSGALNGGRDLNGGNRRSLGLGSSAGGRCDSGSRSGGSRSLSTTGGGSSRGTSELAESEELRSSLGATSDECETRSRV